MGLCIKLADSGVIWGAECAGSHGDADLGVEMESSRGEMRWITGDYGIDRPWIRIPDPEGEMCRFGVDYE